VKTGGSVRMIFYDRFGMGLKHLGFELKTLNVVYILGHTTNIHVLKYVTSVNL